jgi:hypothetical protein
VPLVGQVYRSERATLIQGDSLEVLRDLSDISVDAVVTDPPSGTGFMQRKWDSFKSRDAFVEFLTSRLAECRRVCRPGAVGLVWALPRTSHWTALAIEEAGWVIEDRISHMFGTGFPKAKHRLKPACEDWWLCRNPGSLWLGVEESRIGTDSTIRSQNEGPEWSGKFNGGRRLNGSNSGRWPANVVLSHHPECVCQGTKKVKSGNGVRGSDSGNQMYGGGKGLDRPSTGQIVGYADADGTETVENWTCHPDCPIRLLDEQAGSKGGGYGVRGASTRIYGGGDGFTQATGEVVGFGDSGGPSRFYANFPDEEDTSRMLYCPKANKKDRGEGNLHPTVKSTTLMSWLVKLACLEGGLVLDPFAGSGSTGVACLRTGRRFLGVESDRESCLTAARRLHGEE